MIERSASIVPIRANVYDVPNDRFEKLRKGYVRITEYLWKNYGKLKGAPYLYEDNRRVRSVIAAMAVSDHASVIPSPRSQSANRSP